MIEKQAIKQSEARVLFYLSVAHPTRKYVRAICDKLEMNYNYLMIILQEMVTKGWLTKHKHRRMMFYSLTPEAPLAQAKADFISATEQTQLTKVIEDDSKGQQL